MSNVIDGALDGIGLDASANEMGCWRFKGGVASMVPHLDAPAYDRECKALWRLNPRFVPLWITNEYQSPNDGRVRVVNFGIGAEVRGDIKQRPLRHVIRATSPVYGHRVTGAIVMYDILDGRTHQERQEGKLPAWEPITGKSLEFAEFKAWVDRHMSMLQQMDEQEREASDLQAKVKREIQQNIAYRKRHLDYDLAKAWGCASRIFIPSTFAA